MDYAKLDDAALIRLVAHNREEALSELYDRYNRLVYSLALHILGDRATVEEVTLDVFTRIWQKAESYDAGQAKVSTWLSSIARNRSIDLLRRRSARPEGHSVGFSELPTSAHPQTNGPERATELALQHEAVHQALAELPAEQKEVLELAYFAGLTQREMSEKLGLPLGTVKTRVRLAMNKLRERLQD